MTNLFDPDEIGRQHGEHPPPDRRQSEPSSKRGDSQATELVKLAAIVELFHTPDLEPYATVPIGEHLETCSLRSRAMRRWLARRFYVTHGKAPAQSAIQDALGVLEGRALHEGGTRAVYVRLAEQDGAIYVDLGDERWRSIEIDAAGWRIVDRPPVRFRRPRGMIAFPDPVHGDIALLREFVNVRDGDQFSLLTGSIVSFLRARGPYPVLNFTAEQGSGKSTAQRVIRSLTDPSTTPVRAEPRDVRDVMIAATNSWVVSFDNVSRLSPWLSDAICRLSTGGGFATRELYSDAEETLFDAQRPVMLNGIEELAIRGDLIDRSIILNLPGISEVGRRTEGEFWQEFELARPGIFGGLLSAVSTGLANLPTTKLSRLPRLADMAVWIVAAEPALPWAPGTFLAAYTGNRAEANDLALESSTVVPALRAITTFSGTATELLGLLGAKVDDDARRQRAWPKTPQALSNLLRRLAPNLRTAGIDVMFERVANRRLVVVRGTEGDRDGKSASSASSASPPPGNMPEPGPAHDAPWSPDDSPGGPENDDPPFGSWPDDADDADDDGIPTLLRPCRMCGGADFWIPPGSSPVCASCHPDPALGGAA